MALIFVMNFSITSKESHSWPTKRVKPNTSKCAFARITDLPSTPLNKTFSNSSYIFGCTGIKNDGERQFFSLWKQVLSFKLYLSLA